MSSFSNRKHLGFVQLAVLREIVERSYQNKMPAWYMMNQDELFAEKVPRVHYVAGIHSFTVISEYIFFYENEVLIVCLHLTQDWREVNNLVTLMVDHESANTVEEVELYERNHVTRSRATGGLTARSGLVLVAQSQN